MAPPGDSWNTPNSLGSLPQTESTISSSSASKHHSSTPTQTPQPSYPSDHGMANPLPPRSQTPSLQKRLGSADFVNFQNPQIPQLSLPQGANMATSQSMQAQSTTLSGQNITISQPNLSGPPPRVMPMSSSTPDGQGSSVNMKIARGAQNTSTPSQQLRNEARFGNLRPIPNSSMPPSLNQRSGAHDKHGDTSMGPPPTPQSSFSSSTQHPFNRATFGPVHTPTQEISAVSSSHGTRGPGNNPNLLPAQASSRNSGLPFSQRAESTSYGGITIPRQGLTHPSLSSNPVGANQNGSMTSTGSSNVDSRKQNGGITTIGPPQRPLGPRLPSSQRAKPASSGATSRSPQGPVNTPPSLASRNQIGSMVSMGPPKSTPDSGSQQQVSPTQAGSVQNFRNSASVTTTSKRPSVTSKFAQTNAQQYNRANAFSTSNFLSSNGGRPDTKVTCCSKIVLQPPNIKIYGPSPPVSMTVGRSHVDADRQSSVQNFAQGYAGRYPDRLEDPKFNIAWDKYDSIYAVVHECTSSKSHTGTFIYALATLYGSEFIQFPKPEFLEVLVEGDEKGLKRACLVRQSGSSLDFHCKEHPETSYSIYLLKYIPVPPKLPPGGALGFRPPNNTLMPPPPRPNPSGQLPANSRTPLVSANSTSLMPPPPRPSLSGRLLANPRTPLVSTRPKHTLMLPPPRPNTLGNAPANKNTSLGSARPKTLMATSRPSPGGNLSANARTPFVSTRPKQTLMLPPPRPSPSGNLPANPRAPLPFARPNKILMPLPPRPNTPSNPPATPTQPRTPPAKKFTTFSSPSTISPPKKRARGTKTPIGASPLGQYQTAANGTQMQKCSSHKKMMAVHLFDFNSKSGRLYAHCRACQEKRKK